MTSTKLIMIPAQIQITSSQRACRLPTSRITWTIPSSLPDGATTFLVNL
jgi:hypothetical protein